MTSLTDKPLIFQWEVWLRSLLVLKGLTVVCADEQHLLCNNTLIWRLTAESNWSFSKRFLLQKQTRMLLNCYKSPCHPSPAFLYVPESFEPLARYAARKVVGSGGKVREIMSSYGATSQTRLFLCPRERSICSLICNAESLGSYQQYAAIEVFPQVGWERKVFQGIG